MPSQPEIAPHSPQTELLELSGAAGRRPSESSSRRIATVGGDLAEQLRQILDRLPGRPSRPNELAEQLGLNRDISSRVLRAASTPDPLGVVHVAPGPEPLRRFLRAAQNQGVDGELAEATKKTIRQFELLIREVAGTRSALDAIISASLPDARERFEIASRQSVYKGMSQLKGVQGDTWISTTLVQPAAAHPDRHDVIMVHGALGMQRLRADVVVKFTWRDVRSDPAVAPTDVTAHFEANRADLAPFFFNPPAKLVSEQVGRVVNHILDDHRVGPRSLCDMLTVDHHPGAWDRFASDETRTKKSVFVSPGIPTQTLLMDVILHEDVFPGSEPELVVYDTTTEGMAYINDPTRDIDRIKVGDSIEFIGRDLQRFHAPEFPSYLPMLDHLFERFDLDAARFRGYRCRMQYPVYGWQVCMAFDPPRRS